MDLPPTGHQPVKKKHRRRWPWITGAVVAIFVLIGILNQKPQTNSTPTVGTVATASSTSNAPTTTPTTTVDAPITTTVAAVVAPPPVVEPPVVEPPVVAPAPVVEPPVAPPPAPVTGKYHAGEFCKTVGTTAISTTGAPMTCLQEGKYKRWHNN
jgi:hypothetical protein